MARSYNTPPPALSPLCKQIQTDCCATLLGSKEKADIISQITKLEWEAKLSQTTIDSLRDVRRKLDARICTLEREAIHLEAEGKALVKTVFNATYKGKPCDKNRAWAMLCNELGTHG